MSQTPMALRRAALHHQRLHPINLTLRPFTTTPTLPQKGQEPKQDDIYQARAPSQNLPPSRQKAGKTSSPAEDSQSSASTATEASSDDHPAKQPDPQAEVQRSTGFGNVEGGVKGGKEGLGERSDRDAEGK